MDCSPQSETVSAVVEVEKLRCRCILLPPLIEEFLANQKASWPSYEKPHPPKKSQLLEALASPWIGKLSSCLAIGLLLLSLSWSLVSAIVVCLGLLGVAWGIWGIRQTLWQQWQRAEQLQWQEYQYQLWQWRKAQSLSHRRHSRQLRQLLLGKVSEPSIDKAIAPDGEQQQFALTLKSQFPELKVHIGCEFPPINDCIYQVDMALADPKTGLWLAIFIESNPEKERDLKREEYFLKINWIVVYLSEAQIKAYPERCCRFLKEKITQLIGESC